MTREEQKEFNDALFALGFAMGLIMRMRTYLGPTEAARYDEDYEYLRGLFGVVRGEDDD